MGKLSVRIIAGLKEQGLYPDGHNLYLQVGPTGNKSWAFRFMLNGRARQMGLGPLDLVGLAEARDKAYKARRQLLEGVDPIEARRAARAPAGEPRLMTFADCAAAFVASQEAGWRNEKHRAQWESTLRTYVFPIIGDQPVQAIDIADVLRVLQPVWLTKNETASRVQQRMARVFDWAIASNHRRGDNPATWKGRLDKLLPQRSKVKTVQHHPAMAWTDAPAFMVDLRAAAGVSARALEWIILTGVRTNEAIGGVWLEVADDVWTIPDARMKAHVEHRVPLSRQALELLGGLPRIAGNPHLFPGARTGKPLSNMACLELLRGMRPGLTVHGFRSSFRTWGYEATDHSREILEACLAHANGDKVEAAYKRGAAIEKRRAVMQDWADYLSTTA